MLLATGIGATALEYAPVMPEIQTVQVQEEKQIAEESPVPMDFTPHSFQAAEKDIDDLEVPAFIRRGYNQVERAVAYHG